MKNILCLCDSNTYGYNSDGRIIFDFDTRWTGVLQKLLGNKYRIIEEGCNSRTTFIDDFALPYKNSADYIIPCLLSHAPLDLVIVMLGTNDLKKRFNLTPKNIKSSMSRLINTIKSIDFDTFGKTPKILLVSPIRIDRDVVNVINSNYDLESAKKSEELPNFYKELAENTGCYFFDAGSVAKPAKKDCVHMDANSHKLLAEAISKEVKKIFM